MLDRYYAITQNIAALEAEKDAIRKELLKTYQLGEHEVEGYKVIISKQKRESLDKAKLLTDLGPAQFTKYVKESEYEVIRVKKADQNGQDFS